MIRLHSLIDRFADTRLLCIGDVMLDKFLYGDVSRISPEAPVPIMAMKGESQMLGGAGNVVANLTTLGCGTSFIGVVGSDAQGKELRRFLEETGCRVELIEQEDYATTVKIRFVAGRHHLLRADQEQHLLMTPELSEKILAKVDAVLPEVDVVLLSDYGKGMFDLDGTQTIIARCRAAGKMVIIDPKGADYSRYRGAHLVKPNIKEFREATGLDLNPAFPGWEDVVRAGAEKLYREFGIEQLLVTLSEYGMIFIDARNPECRVSIPTEAREVFDVSGAGDTSLASLGASLAAGAEIAEALELANVAAGIVVGKFGTARVTVQEMKKAVEDKAVGGNAWTRRNNILTAKQMCERVRELKAQGKRIGFTNGCFDLLHLGHLHSFMRTRELCDVLIVGVNSDASVRRLKGETRPINSEEMRSLLLASLDFIDYVVVFDDDTALPLIEQLRPDLIAKEGYPLDRWPEGQLVVSYGGQAIELPRLEGFSTTNIINRMQNP